MRSRRCGPPDTILIASLRILCEAWPISVTPVGGHFMKPSGWRHSGGFIMKVSVLIDGGHLRVLTKKQKIDYTSDYIEKVAHACLQADETLLRVLYYDCAPYNGKARLPVSGAEHISPATTAGLNNWRRKTISPSGSAFSSSGASNRSANRLRAAI